MSDPSTEPAAEVDPLQVIAMNHIAKMEAIHAKRFAYSNQIADGLVERIARNVSLQSALIQKGLVALGIDNKPPQP